VEPAAVDSHNDPCVGQQQVWLLEGLYVFVSMQISWKFEEIKGDITWN
jgi:hypothetical protein